MSPRTTETTSLGTVPPDGGHHIDMQGHGDKLRYLEVLTDAGIIRVNTNLVATRGGQQTIVVEVEPNGHGYTRTAAGGQWNTETDRMGTRTDIRLVREKG